MCQLGDFETAEGARGEEKIKGLIKGRHWQKLQVGGRKACVCCSEGFRFPPILLNFGQLPKSCASSTGRCNTI